LAVAPALHNRGAMRSFVVFVAVVIAAGWVGIRHLPRTAEAEAARVARTQEVESVALDGRGLPAVAALRQAVSTQVGAVVDPAQLASDRAALEAALVTRGYLAAHVAPAKVTRDEDGGAFITFAIEQGRQFRVRSVKLAGATQAEAGVVTLRAGEVVMSDRIERARAALAARLAARGKRRDVAAHVVPDLSAGVVDIELVASR